MAEADDTPRPAVLVTGAGRGIGLEVARTFAARGWHVIATVRDAAGVSAELAADGNVHVVSVDVTDDAGVGALDGVLAGLGGGLSAVVNNAGAVFDSYSTSILDVDLEVLRRTWDVNALGALRIARVAVPHLRRCTTGARIVNVSSGMGQLVDMGTGVPGYRTSKTLLNAFTRILAVELDGEVFVATMCPGWVRTDMGTEAAPRSVAEGADTILWLASGEAEADGARTGNFWRDRAEIAW